MTLYLVYLRDVGQNADIRARHLHAHMAHVGQYLDRIRLGGPLLREPEQKPGGGILIVEAEDIGEVRRMVEADPYYRAGLWDEVRIHAFREIINGWRPA
jgi:hypothetical protein